ncbi:MAG: hypothetical protein CL537_03140 [Alcanivoracaceae bacterium]|nr:hypothetical protein [Alcanivoracaceae bacterium]
MASPIDQLGPGTGTANDPYIIKDLATLDAMRNDNSAHYMMVADVDIGGSLWEPFDFYGVLDGRGYTISNLQVDKSAGGRAGFLRIIYGEVHDLNIETGAPVHVTGHEDDYCGVLAADVFGGARVYRVCCRGVVYSGGNRAGGLVGRAFNTNNPDVVVRECVALVDVGGSSVGGGFVGGLIGNTTTSSSSKPTLLWLMYSPAISDSLAFGSSATAPPEDHVTFASTPEGLADPGTYHDVYDFAGESWEIVDDLPRVKVRPVPIIEVAVGGGGDTPARVAGNVTINRAGAARSLVVISEDGTGARRVAGQGESETDGAFDITFDGWGGDVFVVALDEYGQAFEASAALNQGEIVHPTTPNGYVYEVTTAGTTGASEPTWSTDSAVTSGGVTFNPLPYYRPVASGPLTAEPV